MAKEINIKEELLKQMDQDFSESAGTEEDSARKLAEDHEAQAKPTYNVREVFRAVEDSTDENKETD